MAATNTPYNGIDRKLHVIALSIDPSAYSTKLELARAIEKAKSDEFSRQTVEGTRYVKAGTIVEYITFAESIGVLATDRYCARPKQEIRGLGNFQEWLAELVLDYLNGNKASQANIAEAIFRMFERQPRDLPTIENLHKELKTPLTVKHLRFCLRILGWLRPSVVAVQSRRLYFSPDVINP